MRLLRALLALVAMLVPALVLASAPILNLKDVPVPVKPDGGAYTLDDVQHSIIAGCGYKGWTPLIVGPNKIKATINVRGKHYAEVAITYTARSYSIDYVTSNNLDYDAETRKIHRNYNKWVTLLSEAIQRQFAMR